MCACVCVLCCLRACVATCACLSSDSRPGRAELRSNRTHARVLAKQEQSAAVRDRRAKLEAAARAMALKPPHELASHIRKLDADMREEIKQGMGNPGGYVG